MGVLGKNNGKNMSDLMDFADELEGRAAGKNGCEIPVPRSLRSMTLSNWILIPV